MKFRIDYIDPEDGAAKSTFAEFEDAAGIPAIVWAEDYGYSLARKGYYTVTRVLYDGGRIDWKPGDPVPKIV